MSTQKAITPTEEESEWITTHRPEHATLLWRYAVMFNILDPSWLEGCISPDATYSSQSVFEVLQGSSKIRDYLHAKLESLRESGNSALVRAALAELPGIGEDSACVAIFQAQSEFDRSAWEVPVCCMSLESRDGLISSFHMVTGVPFPASARVSNLFPKAGLPPSSRPALKDATSCHELCFSLYLLDGECPIDKVARREVQLAMQQFHGASYREIVLARTTQEEDMEITELGFVGFPSLAITLRSQILYRHTGLIGAEMIGSQLKEFLAM